MPNSATRTCAFLATLVLGIQVTAQLASAQPWKRVSSFDFDWDHHGTVKVTLEIPINWSSPGDFTRIRIEAPGQKELVLTNEDGWVKYTSKEASLEPKLQITSNNVFRSEHLLGVKASGHRTLLLVFGYSYASSPGSLDVLEMTKTGAVRVILHAKQLGLKEITDLDSDGVSELVTFPCYAQSWGKNLLSYSPFIVYRLSSTVGEMGILSLPLSKAYDLKNYYGWAGPTCREDMAVVLTPGQEHRPILMPAKEAERMAR